MKGDASVNTRTANCDTRELIRDEGDEMEHCMEMSFIHFSVDTYGTGEQKLDFCLVASVTGLGSPFFPDGAKRLT